MGGRGLRPSLWRAPGAAPGTAVIAAECLGAAAGGTAGAVLPGCEHTAAHVGRQRLREVPPGAWCRERAEWPWAARQAPASTSTDGRDGRDFPVTLAPGFQVGPELPRPLPSTCPLPRTQAAPCLSGQVLLCSPRRLATPRPSTSDTPSPPASFPGTARTSRCHSLGCSRLLEEWRVGVSLTVTLAGTASPQQSGDPDGCPGAGKWAEKHEA